MAGTPVIKHLNVDPLHLGFVVAVEVLGTRSEKVCVTGDQRNVIGESSVPRASAVLAKAAAATRWTALPADARAQAEDLFLDTLAVSAGGMAHPDFRPFAESVLCGGGNASAIALAGSTHPLAAVLVNAGATTVLQLQDIHRLGRGHPASHIVPVLMALGEPRNASGERLFGAFVAGYEVCTRIAMSLGGMQDKLHDAGTWGAIGAAVSGAFLLTNGDAGKIDEAIEGAAAVALFPYRDTPVKGATIHHLYIGLGSVIGLTVAQAVAAGLVSLADTVEDFFGPRAGFAFNRDLLCAGVGEDGTWSELQLRNAHFKVHPVCAHIATVMDTVTHLVAAHGIRGQDVAQAEVGIYAYALHYHGENPVNDLAARFSISAMTALALQFGASYAAHLTTADLQRPEVKGLEARVAVRHDPSLDSEYPKGRPSRVTVTLKDGRVFAEKALFPRGDVTNPITRAERRTKALGLFELGCPGRGADIIAAFDAFAAGAPLGDLTKALRG